MPPVRPGPIVRKPKKTKPKPRVVKPPAGDVASSGGNYGMKKAAPAVRKVLKPIHARQHEARDVKSNKDLQRAPRYIRKLNKKAGRGPVKGAKVFNIKGPKVDTSALPPDLADKAIEKALRNFHQVQNAKTIAPAVNALNQTLRPLHAVAGATDAAVTGKNIPKAAKRGLLHNKGPTFSTVLKHVGAPKAVRAPAGFVLDVVADPTTYVTGGTASVARHAAAKEGERVLAKALKAGLPEENAQKIAQRAAKRVYEAHPAKNKGVQVGARAHIPFTNKGFNVKTSGKTTAFLSRKTGLSKAATKVRESGPVQAAGKAFVHDFRPKGRTPVQHEALRAAERQHRATISSGERAIARRYMKALKKEAPSLQEQRQIIDAIEAGKIADLPNGLQGTARELEHDFAHMRKGAAKRGLSRGKFKPQGPEDAQAYLPHVRRVDVEAGGKGKAGGGRVKVAEDAGRSIREPLSSLREKDPSIFTEDLPKIASSKARKELHRRALHDLWQKVASTGREVKPHSNPEMDLGEERMFKVTPRGLEELSKAEGAPDLAAMRSVLDGKRAGKFVILDRRVVEDVKARIANTPSSDEAIHAYDKLTGKIKTLYTVPNPSYHARNLIGDSLNSFLGEGTAKSFAEARAVLGSRITRNRQESATLRGASSSKLDRTVKINGREYTHAEILKEAEQHGAINQGFIGRELRDLGNQGGAVTRASQYREDLPRLATYLAARHRGLSPAEAADWSLKHHFDYADLTGVERKVLRRVIPFYTFFARNTRLQATKIFTRPGKQATIAKVLNDSAQAAGFNSYEDYASSLKDYKQRGLPIPIPYDGQVFDVQIGPPTTDLNQLTTDPGALLQDIANRATFYKTFLFEIPANYSVFFQGKIEDPDHPLVAAPGFVVKAINALPGPLKKVAIQKTGLAQIRDSRTGKTIWAWRAKYDYAMRALPEGNLIAGVTATGTGSRGQSPTEQAVGWLTGAKIVPHTTAQTPITQVNQQLSVLRSTMSKMRQFPPGKPGSAYLDRTDAKGQHFYAPAYIRLLDEQKQLTARRDKLEKVKPVRGTRPPLTPGEKVQKEIEDFQSKQKDPGKAVREEIEQFMSGR